MTKQVETMLRKIPSVDTILQESDIKEITGLIPHKIIIDSIRESIQELRQLIVSGEATDLEAKDLCRMILAGTKQRIASVAGPHYRRVINATGIILHTGLGRAVLPTPALRQIQDELAGYSLLQLDTEEGKRSQRDARIEWLFRQLTGAQAATVVNNNAAATSIVLNTVAKDKEVIVSRGQLVEIGGSFRLPDVMAFSGAKLVEVGTTNKTHARDYENAITENTAAILRVHPSNYKILGFTSEVPLAELTKIAHSNNLVMIDDVGSGALIDFSKFGFEYEPTLGDSISAGADIVTASADKLIGATQGGIILGKAGLIKAIRTNQFARIVRAGKLTLAALEATLMLWLDESVALSEVPTLQMLVRDLTDITRQAKRIASKLRKSVSGAVITTLAGFSQMGSGSLPTQNLTTTLVAIQPESITDETLATHLRRYSTPIFARVQNGRVLIDPRTLRNSDEKILVEALLDILGG
ncbi:MAG: L-seryl-tRNA(Sec) selenium transferase [Planctomycetota bacterium]|jgi:L-seryl-tRNA(Ser) seleniumtransferase